MKYFTGDESGLIKCNIELNKEGYLLADMLYRDCFSSQIRRETCKESQDRRRTGNKTSAIVRCFR